MQNQNEANIIWCENHARYNRFGWTTVTTPGISVIYYPHRLYVTFSQNAMKLKSVEWQTKKNVR